MAQVPQSRLQIEPVSIVGFARSVQVLFKQMSVTNRSLVCSTAITLIWVVYVYRYMFSLGYPTYGSCITTLFVYDPLPYLWNFLVVRSFYQLVVLTLLIITVDLSVDHKFDGARWLIKTVSYTVHLGFIFGYLQNVYCFPAEESLAPLLASAAIGIHVTNPKIYTDGFPWPLRLPFVVETRWFIWFLLWLYTFAIETEDTVVYSVALLTGSVLYLPDIYKGILGCDKNVLLNMGLVYAGMALFPFSIGSFRSLPFSGPVIIRTHNALVKDYVSLVAFHSLTWLPLIVLSNKQHKLQLLLLASIVVCLIYTLQCPLMDIPGPGILCLVIAVYRIVVA